MKGLLILFVLAFASVWLVDRFVVQDPSDPESKGFVPYTPGLGLDDVARAAGIALGIYFGGKVLRPMLGGKKG